MKQRSGSFQSTMRLAERVIELLDQGSFVATYKYAVLIGLMDLCLEMTSAKGRPPDMVTTRQLAEKVIEIYWPHSVPYLNKGVLRQSPGEGKSQAQIVRGIQRFREKIRLEAATSLPLTRATALAKPGAYENLVRLVEWKLIEMPLPRLQRVGPEQDLFLYEYGFEKGVERELVRRYQRGETDVFDNRLNFKPGVASALVALNGVVRPLIHRQWTMMVAQMNGLEELLLERFLFGAERISTEPVRHKLCALQRGRCFYCKRNLDDAYHVDHFIPWSRHPDNGVHNLVAAHEECNQKKSDFLAAAVHVERWRERSRNQGAELGLIAQQASWESRPERTLGVARAVYLKLPDGVKLWWKRGKLVELERPRIRAALIV